MLPHCRSHGSFSLATDDDVGRVSYESFHLAVKTLIARRSVDAVIISCTAFDVVNHLPRFQRELGCRILASSQVFAWHALKLLDFSVYAERVLEGLDWDKK